MIERFTRLKRNSAALVAILIATAVGISLAVPATAAVLVGTKNIKNQAVTAKKIKKNAVKPRHIDGQAVRPRHIKKQAVKPRHLAPNTITHVLNQLDVSELKGEKGDTGVVGIYSLSEGVFIPANSDTGTKYLTCDEDDLALSGGFSYPQGSGIEVVESQPGTSDRNWSFKAHNTSNTEKAVNLHVKCLRVS